MKCMGYIAKLTRVCVANLHTNVCALNTKIVKITNLLKTTNSNPNLYTIANENRATMQNNHLSL